MIKAKPYVVSENPIRRNLNVESAINDLDGAVSDLRDAVSELESQLAPLLAPERPCGNDCDRSQGESELADRILSNFDRTRQLSARIRELIDRL